MQKLLESTRESMSCFLKVSKVMAKSGAGLKCASRYFELGIAVLALGFLGV